MTSPAATPPEGAPRSPGSGGPLTSAPDTGPALRVDNGGGGSASNRAFPRELGTYLLLGSLGRGGMGEVFLARRGRLRGAERLLVLKTMRQDVDDEAAERFLDEAKLAVALAHANICHVFDVGRVGRDLYLAMEHIAGITLRALVDATSRAKRTLPASHAIYVVTELLDALDYAHRRSHPITRQPLAIVHRDVSPQNVMVTFEGEVKLIDFGLAASRLKQERSSNDAVSGKLAYMSPEQMRGEVVDARTDQFAAGILLYELLTGQRFYGDLDRNAVIAAALNGRYKPSGFDLLDREIAAVLGRAISFERHDRFETCDAFAAALRAIIARRGLAVSRANVRDLIRVVMPSAAKEQERQIAIMAANAEGVEGPASGDKLAQPAVHGVGPNDATVIRPPAVVVTESEELSAPDTDVQVRPVIPLSQEGTARTPAMPGSTDEDDVTLAVARPKLESDEAATKPGDVGAGPPSRQAEEPTAAIVRAPAHAAEVSSIRFDDETHKDDLRSRQANRAPKPVAALLLGLSLVIVVTALFLVIKNALDDERDAGPRETVPAVGAREVPAMEPGEDAEDVAESGADADDALASDDEEDGPEPVPGETKRVTRKKRANTKTTASDASTSPGVRPAPAVMWQALEKCSESCAKGLVITRDRTAGVVDPAVLERCYARCPH